MADRSAEGAAPAAEALYQSLAAMREAHGELLKGRRAAGLHGPALVEGPRTDAAAEQLAAEAAAFIAMGRATGRLLDLEDERAAAQSLLTYWANILQRMGRAVDDAILAEFDPDLAPALPDDACPYLGLDAFGEDDSGRFFGREGLVAELVARLDEERVLLVSGPSGSGKSSLVRAGLLPALRRGAAPGSEGWRLLAPVVPGGEPFVSLARALEPGATRQQSLQLARRLRAAPALLASMLGGPGDPPALLVIDQFEELFTLVEAEAELQAVAAALLAVVAWPEHRVVLTMRSDFEPFATALPGLGEGLERGKLPVLPLSAPALRQAIEAPAQAVGLKLEPGVVELLIQDIAGEPAGLPLLQFTLLKLWSERERNRITLAAYERVGGGRQALARSADAFYDGLIPEEQVTTRRLLLRMVRPGDGLEVTSSRVRLDSLYALGEDPGRVERVVQKLVDERLLRMTPGEAGGPPQVEVAHEALVRNWPRLVGWLEDERVALHTRRRLEQRAAEWQRLGAARAGLLDEAQLREAEHWVASPEALYLGYSPLVTRLIYASREALREAEAERERVRQRELAQARALAAEQQARAEAQAARAAAERRGRTVSRILSALMAVLATGTLLLFLRADELSLRAAQQRAVAEQAATANAGLAGTADALRQVAEEQSRVEQQLRATAETAGTAAALRAAEAAANARAARAGELAAQAQAALTTAPQLGLLLAVESVLVTEPPPEVARNALYTAVSTSDGEGLGNHAGPIVAATASADGMVVATAGEDGVRLWDPNGPAGPRAPLGELGEPARLVALSADGRWLAAAGLSRVLLYPLEAGRAGSPVEVFSGAEVTALGISPGGASGPWLLVADRTGRVVGATLGPGGPGPLGPISRPGDAAGPVRALAFSPDGAFALSGGDDRVVRVWDLRPARGTSRYAGNAAPRSAGITAIAVSSDGRRVAIGARDGSIHLWGFGAAGLGAGPGVKLGHQGAITALSFSPDGAWLLSGSADRNGRLWPAAGFGTTAADGLVLTGHSRALSAASFSPDGRLAATGGADGELLVWRLAAPGQAGLRLRGHDGPVTAVLVAGGRLLSTAADGQLRRWPMEPQGPDERAAAVAAQPLAEVISAACALAGRSLRADELARYFPGEAGRGPTCRD